MGERPSPIIIFKCKPSGKLIVKRKTKYFDVKKGDLVYPGEDDSEDTGLNINDLPWEAEMKTAQDEMLIEFCVTGFAKPPSEVLGELGIDAFESWLAGDTRVPNTLLKHKDNGFRLRESGKLTEFEECVRDLLARIYPVRNQLAALGAQLQLSCVFHLSGSERPVIYFAKETLARIVEIGASIDVDVYDLGDDEPF